MGIAVVGEAQRLLQASGEPVADTFSDHEYDLLEQEDSRVAGRRRLLITSFLADRSEILDRVLGRLNDGVQIDGLSERARYSIDGSLSTVIEGAALMSIVAHLLPLSTTGEAELVAMPQDRVNEAVASAVSDAIGTPKGSTRVRPLPIWPNDVFVDRSRFTEYRFGCPTSSLGSLTKVAKAFTDQLGVLEVPIAYLYFPDVWESSATTNVWLRVGIGLLEDSSDLLGPDLAALSAARLFQCELQKYDPSLPAAGMSDKFRRIFDYCNSRPPDVRVPLASSELDIVFTSGQAKAGLVSKILSCGDHNLVGGTMTVLAGNTIGSWVLKPGTGEAFKKRLIELKLPDLESPEVLRVPLPEAKGDSHQGVLWLAWRCSDEPGVFSSLLRAVRTCFSEEISVDYEISRVLASGNTCAGKARFEVPRASPADIIRVRDRCVDAVQPFLAGWDPGRQDWLENPVLVDNAEPGADPWASLAVF